MCDAQVRGSGGGRRVLGLVFTVVFCVGAGGCGSTSLAPVGKLVPASDVQFRAPVSIAVTAGSTGQESSVSKEAHWWLSSAEADVTVFNNSGSSPLIDITANVIPPPCPGPAEVVLVSPGSPTVRLVAGPSGRRLLLRLHVPRGMSKRIHLSVLTPACRIATDPRSLYAGLAALEAKPRSTDGDGGVGGS